MMIRLFLVDNVPVHVRRG